MKQGTANSKTGNQKSEPIAHAVSPGAASEIGVQQIRTTSLPLYEGRGLEAPTQSITSHRTGSQGKHE